MNEKDVRRLLLSLPVPDEQRAEERTWETVRRAFADREPVPAPRRRPWKLLAVAVAAAALIGIAVSPVGSEIGGWIRDKVGRERVVGVTPAKPALVALPGSGRLLVASPSGVWVVGHDGSRRRLGAYAAGTWSPNGLFVAVWKGRQLTALDPERTDGIHWSLTRQRIADARWSPSGYRVAYRSGRSLRVVVGNGTDDRRVAGHVAPVAPAWKLADEHVLAYVDPARARDRRETDAGKRIWTTRRLPEPVSLAWTDAGRLGVLSRHELRIFDGNGELTRIQRFGAGTGGSLAARPGDESVAFTVFSRESGNGEVWLYDIEARRARILFSGAGRFDDIAWSPDGRLLLLGWAAADQWLFVEPRPAGHVIAVSSASEGFTPGADGEASFPRVDGWCCPESFR